MVSPQVLVVGSGPSGLALALTLLQNGVSVRIIEKNTEHHHSERGSGIQPRTLEIEHFLGVGEEVQRMGLPSPCMVIYDQKDPYRVVKSFEVTAKVDPTPAFPITEVRMVGQWLHQQILRKNLEKYGCQVELGCRLASLEQQEEGVFVHLAKTEDGKESEETARFAYVVGADGARSTVRKALGIHFIGESKEIRTFLVDVRVEGLPAGGKDFHRWGDGGTRLASLRYTVQPGVFQMLLAAPELDFDALNTGSLEATEAAFHMLSGRKDLRVTKVISYGEWRPNMRIAERFRDGRVFIIGDAAHVHSPTGGQGLNTSIQDAFNLAWKLALSLKSQASSRVLDSYESERLPVIAEMLKITTDLFNKTVAARVEMARALEAAKATGSEKNDTEDYDRVAFSRDRKLLQLDINYRWSEIVFDERFETEGKEAQKRAYGVAEHDIRAGDRAPDAPGLVRLDLSKKGDKSIARLFDLFTTSSHSVLIFTPDHISSATRDLLGPLAKLQKDLVRTAIILPASASASGLDASSSGADYVFCDADSHAYKDYGLDVSASVPVAVIVRPDATIGAFALSKTGVEKYLSLVFA